MLTFCIVQLFLTDNATAFSQKIGWTNGERTGRYAIVIDHGKVVYAENEPGGDVTVIPQEEMWIRPVLTMNRFPVPRLCLRNFECLERKTCIVG